MPQNLSVRLYTPSDADRWNDFVAKARNATFLFNRGFMDYHAERFADYSLIVQADDKWLAVLPAHQNGDVVSSHWGLTYGGLLYADVRLADVLQLFKSILSFLADAGVNRLRLKLIPPIYCDKPSDELAYALFLADAKLTRRDTLSVIDFRNKVKLSKDRLAGIKRAEIAGLRVLEENRFDTFWNEILIPNLKAKHNAAPVHSLEEIELLHSRFPENIRQFNVYHDGKLVAGTTLFISKNVVHSQYISGNDDKNQLGSLDFLHRHILDLFSDNRYFDFGISNESDGRKLNEGLAYWKQTFGATTVSHDFYEVYTANFKLLDDVLL